MKLVLGLAALVVLSGRMPLPPVEPHAAPAPSPQELEQARTIQTRTLPIAMDAVFPKVVDVLLDNGYLIRSVNERVGVVSFSQNWVDATQHDAIINQEGSLFFKPLTASSTQVRVAMTQSWQRFEVTGGGKNSTDSGMVGGAKQTAGADEYKKILDLLEQGMSPATK